MIIEKRKGRGGGGGGRERERERRYFLQLRTKFLKRAKFLRY